MVWEIGIFMHMFTYTGDVAMNTTDKIPLLGEFTSRWAWRDKKTNKICSRSVLYIFMAIVL